MPDYPVFDIHIHTYPASAIGMQAKGGRLGASGHAGTLDELLPYMGEAGMDGAAMMNFTPVADMADAAWSRVSRDVRGEERERRAEEIRLQMVGRVRNRNAWTCDAAAKDPRLLAFIGVDTVMDPNTMAAEVVERHASGARGVKLHTEVQRIALNDARLWPAYRAAETAGMAVLAHMGPFRGSSGAFGRPAMAADVLRAFPRLKLILAHAGGHGFRREALEIARAFPNVRFDTCGVVPWARNVALSDEETTAFFRELGVPRLLFGSDWADEDTRNAADDIARLPLTDAEKRLILSANARDLFQV